MDTRVVEGHFETGKHSKNASDSFHVAQLSPKESDLWDQLIKGLSPARLLRHPLFWSVERTKCFVLDVANSRNDLTKEKLIPEISNETIPKADSQESDRLSSTSLPRLVENWITTLERSDFNGIMER